MKAVYVTGCLGFIGSYVTRACLRQGWYVKGIDKMTYAARPELLKEFKKWETFSFMKEDISYLETIHDCDYVINLAAESHVGNSIVSSDEFISSNINGVHNLLELIRLNKYDDMPTFLHFSTDEVYGDIVKGEHTEKDILKPSNPYSASKAAADQLVLAWNRTYDLPYIIVRPTNNYGVGQYTEKLIPKVCKYLKLDKKIPLHNNGTPIRNWLHAEDTARAIITIIKSNSKNEIYNIAGGFEQTNFVTVKKVIGEYNKSIYINPNEVKVEDYADLSYSRIGQDVRYALNDDKLRSLGWEPKIDFDKELDKIVKYYQNNFIW